MGSSYYSPDAILTDAQKVPCTFEIPIPGLGFLDDNPGGDVSTAQHSVPEPLPPSLHPPIPTKRTKRKKRISHANISCNTQIPAHQPLPLPLWLAFLLAVQRYGPLNDRPVLTADLPASLSTRVLNALRADPRTVDLRAIEPYFYEGVVRLLDLFEEDEIGDLVGQAWVARSQKVGDSAVGRGTGEEGWLRGLEEWERSCELHIASLFSFLSFWEFLTWGGFPGVEVEFRVTMFAVLDM
ncbi:MAG: hypothetical protein LQ351_001843 [Letrouitia transgressa]|nr:MAG: hypothetical protein LQ351_001843 [Letrouitia transgressa]